MTARILECTPDEYHSLPGFSASTAKVLLERSPLHAKEAHGKKPSKEMDRGAVCHRLLLGKGAEFAVLPFDDWKTKDAQKSRDNARRAGLVPITHVQHSAYETAASEIRKRLDAYGYFISPRTGRSELAIEWTERTRSGSVLCRCMMDHVELDRGRIFELKIVDDASPERCERSAENMGYAVSAAAYVRALAALRPDLIGRIEYRFLFCEAEPPYAVYDPEPDGEFLESGERKWLQAVDTWARCTEENDWPHYQGRGQISRPRWALLREGNRINE